jgi:hypothetical protein
MEDEWYKEHLNEEFECVKCSTVIKRKECYGFEGQLDEYCEECFEKEKLNKK